MIGTKWEPLYWISLTICLLAFIGGCIAMMDYNDQLAWIMMVVTLLTMIPLFVDLFLVNRRREGDHDE